MVSWVVFFGVQMPQKKTVFGSLGSICVDFSDCTLPKCKKLRLGEPFIHFIAIQRQDYTRFQRVGFAMCFFQIVYINFPRDLDRCMCSDRLFFFSNLKFVIDVPHVFRFFLHHQQLISLVNACAPADLSGMWKLRLSFKHIKESPACSAGHI